MSRVRRYIIALALVVAGLAWRARTLFRAIMLAAAITGCTPAWHEAGCELADRAAGGREWRCGCTLAELRVGPVAGSAAAGTVTITCDGKALPVTVTAKRVPRYVDRDKCGTVTP